MVKEQIKKCKILYHLLREAKKFCIKIWVNVFPHVRLKRRNEIENFKGIHCGERCFIVATGPSLTLDDLEKIKYEYSFSMNSIINLYSKTNYRPTYYLIQDGLVEQRLRNKLIYAKHNVSFIGIGNIGGFKSSGVLNKHQAKRYQSYIPYNLDVAYHIIDMYYSAPDKIKAKFSNDCAQIVYDGCTVTYSAIQLACYMGFKEIYLIGCDATSSGHVDEKINNTNITVSTNLMPAYQAAKEYADSHGIKIYNATRGGKLEVFERVDFDSLFPPEDSENNVPKIDK